MNYLNVLANIPGISRLTWLDEPIHLNKEDYYYSPTYSLFTGRLLHNWEESDSSLRNRIKQRVD